MKQKIIDLFGKHKQFILFCMVGASNTLITMGVLAILTKLNVQYYIASPIAYTCGIINGYLWSSKVVFKKCKTVNNAIKFVIVNMFVLATNSLLMFIWVDKLLIQTLWAQALSICFTMPLNFILNKIWTYRSKVS